MTLHISKGTEIPQEDREVLTAAGIKIEEYSPERNSPLCIILPSIPTEVEIPVDF